MKRLVGCTAFCISAYAFKSSTSKLSSKEVHTRNAISLVFPYKDSGARGVVSFSQDDVKEKVKVVASVWGLNPNSVYSMSIHEFGDIGGSLDDMGRPFPVRPLLSEKVEGLGTEQSAYACTLKTDERGNVYSASTSPQISLFGKSSVVGRSVRIDSTTDAEDKSTGEVVGLGIIGLAKEFKNVIPR